ncbi:unnamed protein product [Gongylonema pulchrum]|uniref:DUF1726 domain-containing protein n=1 Tax=Gongylonema pulchrum TaxID=637853 RepID=A0A183E3W3_9BILA|nr:unnamed protein product [Gongylonema pulchrum]
MVRTKLDNRIRTVIENGVNTGHRSMFVVVGDKGKDQENDPFDLFISSTHIRYCYYNETHKILGNTFGMLVLQDFEAITPNLLARTVETIEGGGVIVLLLKSVGSLKQLYTMTMDVHSRFRTESHKEIVPRFNERFILSLASCRSCLVVDDCLNVLPLSSHISNIDTVPASAKVLFCWVLPEKQ